MSQHVYQHFIRPMSACFSARQGQDFSAFTDQLIDELKGFDGPVLERAAASIRRSRRMTTWPTLAECLEACRDADFVKARTEIGPAERLYRYRKPSSRILENRITAENARGLVEQGRHPRGSIWVPGLFGSGNEGVGQLYAPDPEWQKPQFIEPRQPVERPFEGQQHREAVVERYAKIIASIGAPGSKMLDRKEMRQLPAGTIIEAGGRIVHTNGYAETFEDFRLRLRGKAA